MKALVYAGPKRVEVQEVKEPEKQDGKVKKSTAFAFHLKEKQSELPYMKRVLMHWHT